MLTLSADSNIIILLSKGLHFHLVEGHQSIKTWERFSGGKHLRVPGLPSEMADRWGPQEGSSVSLSSQTLSGHLSVHLGPSSHSHVPPLPVLGALQKKPEPANVWGTFQEQVIFHDVVDFSQD